MAASKGVTVNLEIVKGVIDWTLKIAPFIGVAISFFVAQDRTVDRSKLTQQLDDTRITKLETELNEMKRDETQRTIELRALQQHIEDQEKYYLLTTKAR